MSIERITFEESRDQLFESPESYRVLIRDLEQQMLTCYFGKQRGDRDWAVRKGEMLEAVGSTADRAEIEIEELLSLLNLDPDFQLYVQSDACAHCGFFSSIHLSWKDGNPPTKYLE
jgi:hypothetical protein